MTKAFSQISVWLYVSLMVLSPFATHAQTLKGHLNTVGGQISNVGATGKKLPEFIGSLLNVFLSALGLIFIVLVVYAGYLWMTAGGEATKVDKAKKLLGQAVIGLVITVGAFAISSYVIDAVSKASTGTPPG